MSSEKLVIKGRIGAEWGELSNPMRDLQPIYVNNDPNEGEELSILIKEANQAYIEQI